MLVGKLKASEKESAAFSPEVRRALDFLRDTDFTKLADGRYEIDGENCYAKLARYTTKPAELCRPEAHRRYADIQYMVEGEEHIDVWPLGPALTVAEPYDETKDIEFFAGLASERLVPLHAGDFVLLTPKDVHRPGVAAKEPRTVVKVVVKIAVEFL